MNWPILYEYGKKILDSITINIVIFIYHRGHSSSVDDKILGTYKYSRNGQYLVENSIW